MNEFFARLCLIDGVIMLVCSAVFLYRSGALVAIPWGFLGLTYLMLSFIPNGRS